MRLESLRPNTEFGPYRLERLLARGGMGQLFLAKAFLPGLGDRRLVIKVLHPDVSVNEDSRAMFLHEARLGTMITHPNIAKIYDFGDIDGILYFAMEYVDGPPVSRIMRALGSMGLADALTIVNDVAVALGHAHGATDAVGQPLHIVHRDVTPHNILISSSGGVKLIDFGVARSAGQDHQTSAGVLKGKLSYMAPEQFGGQVDHRTDIFALGVIVHELVSAKRLFKKRGEAETFTAILQDPIPPLIASNEVREVLEPIVMRALARNKEERYSDAAEFAADLQSAMQTLELSSGAGQLAKLVERTIAFYRAKSKGSSESEASEGAGRSQNEGSASASVDTATDEGSRSTSTPAAAGKNEEPPTSQPPTSRPAPMLESKGEDPTKPLKNKRRRQPPFEPDAEPGEASTITMVILGFGVGALVTVVTWALIHL